MTSLDLKPTGEAIVDEILRKTVFASRMFRDVTRWGDPDEVKENGRSYAGDIEFAAAVCALEIQSLRTQLAEAEARVEKARDDAFEEAAKCIRSLAMLLPTPKELESGREIIASAQQAIRALKSTHESNTQGGEKPVTTHTDKGTG